MYILDGIAYAGEQHPTPRLYGLRPLPGHRLWARFQDGQQRVYDFTPLLSHPAFAPLKDEEVFRAVYLDYGCPNWLDGQIDFDPAAIYAQGAPVGGALDA